MNPSASSLLISEPLGEAKGADAVDYTKLTVLAVPTPSRRNTFSSTLKIWAATRLWISRPRRKSAALFSRRNGPKAAIRLRIIRGKERPASFRQERLANLSPKLAANGDVLQVRIARAKPAGGRHV